MIFNAIINIQSLKDDTVQSVKSKLSKDDLTTYDSYYIEEDKQRMLASRFLLDAMLEKFFSLPSYLAKLVKEKSGKPVLEGFWGLSISHSGQYALISLSKDFAVGNDIQKRVILHEEVILSTLHKEEIHEYKNLPKTLQQKWFQKRWCEKEAILKAEGVGLDVEPSSFLVSENQGSIKGYNNHWCISTSPKELEAYEMVICTSLKKAPIRWYQWTQEGFKEWK